MQSVPFSTNGSAHLELRYPGEGLPQLPAVEKFSKRKQLVGIVQHLSVDGTGADHPLFAALFELVTVQTQHLADLAHFKDRRTAKHIPVPFHIGDILADLTDDFQNLIESFHYRITVGYRRKDAMTE